MTKTEFYNLILAIVLFLSMIVQSIITFSFYIILIMLTVMISVLIIFIIVDRRLGKDKIRKIPNLMFISLIFASIFPENASIPSVIITVLFSFSLFFIIFNGKNLENYIINPVLIGFLIYLSCFPENLKNFNIEENLPNISQILQKGNASELFYSLKESLIGEKLIISYISVGIIAILFRRINLFSLLSFTISFMLLTLIFNNLSSGLFLNGFFFTTGFFLFSDRNVSPQYTLSSLLSGVIVSIIFLIINSFTNIAISLFSAIPIMNLVNPYIDKLIFSLKNRKIMKSI